MATRRIQVGRSRWVRGWSLPGITGRLALAGLGALALTGCTAREEAAPAKSVATAHPIDAETARTLYVRHCAACHGPEGHGDGPAGQHLYPKPRAFSDSPMRFAATGAGEDRVLDAIARTIREGMPRSSMPGFGGVLTEPEVRGIARYVHDLGSDVPAPAARDALIAGKAPEFTAGLVTYGSSLFRSMGCITCHGDKGHGDGAAMEGLVDSLGRPIHPANLASGEYKAGARPDDLYRVIVNGVPGTPMPAYADMLFEGLPRSSVGHRKAWALVAYVMSLAPPPTGAAANSGAEIVLGQGADPGMFDDPSHSAWLGVRETSGSLRPLWQRPEPTRSVSVAALRAGDRVAFRLVWNDPTCDVDHDSGDFPDAVAVMFAMGDEVAALPMGVEVAGYTPASPVNVWQWKASRQYDTSTGRRHDSTDPRTLEGEGYFVFAPVPNGAQMASLASARGDDLRLLDPYNLAAARAGNPHADASVVRHAVLEANALGFGTLTYQAPDMQHTNASALWANGRWFVTAFRSLSTGDDEDIDLSSPRRVPVAFAVWDGSRGDRAGVKLISGWHWLVIEPSTGAAAGDR